MRAYIDSASHEEIDACAKQGLYQGGHEHLFSRILLERSDGDESQAFDLFFTYLDEYRREPPAVSGQ